MKRYRGKPRVHTTPIPNDPYKTAGMDSRNGDIKVMDGKGNLKYTVPNRGQFEQGRKVTIRIRRT